jgi:predicted nucleotidyltransferase
VKKSHKEIREHLVETLLEAVPSCQAIYRFGSWGTDAERSDSDIDIAVLPSFPLELIYRWELAQKIATFAGRDVDLIDLLRAPTVLRMQVIAHGERLYCADANALDLFEDMVFSSYARLNEERRDVLADIHQRGKIFE